MLRAALVTRRNRRKGDPSQPPLGTNAALTLAIEATNVRVTSNVPLAIGGIPAITVQGLSAVSITRTSPSSFLLDYAANVVAGNAFVVPDRDPNLRTYTGGYAIAQAGTF